MLNLTHLCVARIWVVFFKIHLGVIKNLLKYANIGKNHCDMAAETVLV